MGKRKKGEISLLRGLFTADQRKGIRSGLSFYRNGRFSHRRMHSFNYRRIFWLRTPNRLISICWTAKKSIRKTHCPMLRHIRWMSERRVVVVKDFDAMAGSEGARSALSDYIQKTPWNDMPQFWLQKSLIFGRSRSNEIEKKKELFLNLLRFMMIVSRMG